MPVTARRIASLPCVFLLMAMGTFDSCSDDPSPGIQGSLTIAGGDGQSGPVSDTLSQRLLVQFRGVDESNTDLGDVAVEWEVLTGGGAIIAGETATRNDGTAGATWILGADAGPQTARASIPDADPELRVTFTATATGGSQTACTNPQVFQDDFEEERTWVDTVIVSNQDITASVSYETASGNPGGYRRMMHHFPSSGNQETIAVHHIYIEDGYYVPIEQGPVSHLRVTEDRIKFAPTGPNQIGTGFIVRKNDIDHIALLTGGVFGNESWGSVTVDLTGNDFSPPVDLSTGSYIFGYLRSNSSAGPIDLIHGLDNWKVEVCR